MLALMNREKELTLIKDAIAALTSTDRLVETPIVNFFGLPGIGKSRLLDEVVSICDLPQVRWLRLDATRDIPVFSPPTVQRIGAYISGTEPPASLDDSIDLLKTLLKDAALVLLVDNIESTDEQQVDMLENILKELILSSSIFIVLASQSELSFHHQRNVRRKLTPQPLSLLDKTLSAHYFLTHLPTFPQQERLYIWTRGHPLAMEELVQAINEHGGRADEPMHPQLIQRLLDALITRRLRERVPGEQEWFETMLRLLAVPRRFNVIFIRVLVERFAPDSYRLSSSVEYMTLPQKIGQVTGVLQWKRELAGFTLEEPVRTLLLLQLKIQFAERYRALNVFLAERNWQYARETEHIEDRVQYEKEFVYHHLTSAADDGKVEAAIEALQQILTLASGEQRQLIRFQEEFLADRELQEELGEGFAPVRQHLYREIAAVLYRLYLAAGPQAQGQAFDDIFTYLGTLQERDREVREAMITEYLNIISTERNSGWLLERYRRLTEADSNGL